MCYQSKVKYDKFSANSKKCCLDKKLKCIHQWMITFALQMNHTKIQLKCENGSCVIGQRSNIVNFLKEVKNSMLLNNKIFRHQQVAIFALQVYLVEPQQNFKNGSPVVGQRSNMVNFLKKLQEYHTVLFQYESFSSLHYTCVLIRTSLSTKTSFRQETKLKL